MHPRGIHAILTPYTPSSRHTRHPRSLVPYTPSSLARFLHAILARALHAHDPHALLIPRSSVCSITRSRWCVMRNPFLGCMHWLGCMYIYLYVVGLCVGPATYINCRASEGYTAARGIDHTAAAETIIDEFLWSHEARCVSHKQARAHTTPVPGRESRNTIHAILTSYTHAILTPYSRFSIHIYTPSSLMPYTSSSLVPYTRSSRPAVRM